MCGYGTYGEPKRPLESGQGKFPILRFADMGPNCKPAQSENIRSPSQKMSRHHAPSLFQKNHHIIQGHH